MTKASLQVMIGRRMKARRAMLDMRQEELAARTGIPQAHISRYERGAFQSINPVRLVAIAKALDMTVDALFGMVDGATDEDDVVSLATALLAPPE